MCLEKTDGPHAGHGTASENDDQLYSYWPPPHDVLHCVSVEVLSLHNLPKKGEMRPRYSGSREACHRYHPELSGVTVPPNDRTPSAPSLSLSLHPIGGFCALGDALPLPYSVQTEVSLPPAQSGMNVAMGKTIHLVAAEPFATILRISVSDRGKEVAHETAVLGRLRGGYRVLQMRGPLGTRIELAFLLVKISFASETNVWATR
eukprot:7384978-Prymnesium_polylepis.1